MCNPLKRLFTGCKQKLGFNSYVANVISDNYKQGLKIKSLEHDVTTLLAEIKSLNADFRECGITSLRESADRYRNKCMEMERACKAGTCERITQLQERYDTCSTRLRDAEGKLKAPETEYDKIEELTGNEMACGNSEVMEYIDGLREKLLKAGIPV